MNVSLPATMRKWVEGRVQKDGFGTVSEYVRALIRDDQQRDERRSIDEELLRSLKSPAAEMTSAEWTRARREIQQRLSARRPRKSA